MATSIGRGNNRRSVQSCLTVGTSRGPRAAERNAGNDRGRVSEITANTPLAPGALCTWGSGGVSCRLALRIGPAETACFSGPHNNVSLTANGGNFTMRRIILTAVLLSASALLAWVSVSATDSGPFLSDSATSDLVGGTCWISPIPSYSCSWIFTTFNCTTFVCNHNALGYYCTPGQQGQIPGGCYVHCKQSCSCSGAACCTTGCPQTPQKCGVKPNCGCPCQLGSNSIYVCSLACGSTALTTFPNQSNSSSCP